MSQHVCYLQIFFLFLTPASLWLAKPIKMFLILATLMTLCDNININKNLQLSVAKTNTVYGLLCIAIMV